MSKYGVQILLRFMKSVAHFVSPEHGAPDPSRFLRAVCPAAPPLPSPPTRISRAAEITLSSIHPEASRSSPLSTPLIRADERRLGPPPLLDARCGWRRLQQRQVPPTISAQGVLAIQAPISFLKHYTQIDSRRNLVSVAFTVVISNPCVAAARFV